MNKNFTFSSGVNICLLTTKRQKGLCLEETSRNGDGFAFKCSHYLTWFLLEIRVYETASWAQREEGGFFSQRGTDFALGECTSPGR